MKHYDELVERTGRALAAIDIYERYHPEGWSAGTERQRAAGRLQYERGYVAAMEAAARMIDVDMNEWRQDSFRYELARWQDVLAAERPHMYVDYIQQTEQAMTRHMETLKEVF